MNVCALEVLEFASPDLRNFYFQTAELKEKIKCLARLFEMVWVGLRLITAPRVSGKTAVAQRSQRMEQHHRLLVSLFSQC